MLTFFGKRQAMTSDGDGENTRDRDRAQQIAAVKQAPGYPGSEETP